MHYYFYKVVICALSVILSANIFASDFTVGVLYWSMNIQGQVVMRKGLEREANLINAKAKANKKKKVKLITRVGGDGVAGIENQIKQMDELIKMKVDIIIVQPCDNAALSSSLKKANMLGIPVVAYDQYISSGKLAAYRTSDNYQAGYLDGEVIASKYNKKELVKLILVEYPHVSSTVERVNGFLDALKKYSINYKVLKTYNAIEPVMGKKVGLQILKDFPNKKSVDVVFTVNDGCSLAIVDVLKKASRKEIAVATIDGDPASIVNVKNGNITVVDCAQFCGPLGAEAMKAAYGILNKEKVPYHALVPVFPVTKKTISKYPGWFGPIPKQFSKPWKSFQPTWEGSLHVIENENKSGQK